MGPDYRVHSRDGNISFEMFHHIHLKFTSVSSLGAEPGENVSDDDDESSWRISKPLTRDFLSERVWKTVTWPLLKELSSGAKQRCFSDLTVELCHSGRVQGLNQGPLTPCAIMISLTTKSIQMCNPETDVITGLKKRREFTHFQSVQSSVD